MIPDPVSVFRRGAYAPIVGVISTPAWRELTDREQLTILAVDDYERGRFDLAALRRRLREIRDA